MNHYCYNCGKPTPNHSTELFCESHCEYMHEKYLDWLTKEGEHALRHDIELDMQLKKAVYSFQKTTAERY